MIGDRRQKHNKKQGFVVEISPNLLIFICVNETALNRTTLEFKLPSTYVVPDLHYS